MMSLQSIKCQRGQAVVELTFVSYFHDRFLWDH